MSFDSIQTISFDATGTLFDPVPSIGGIYAEVLHNHGVFLTEPELEMRFMAELLVVSVVDWSIVQAAH